MVVLTFLKMKRHHPNMPDNPASENTSENKPPETSDSEPRKDQENTQPDEKSTTPKQGMFFTPDMSSVPQNKKPMYQHPISTPTPSPQPQPPPQKQTSPNTKYTSTQTIPNLQEGEILTTQEPGKYILILRLDDSEIKKMGILIQYLTNQFGGQINPAQLFKYALETLNITVKSDIEKRLKVYENARKQYSLPIEEGKQ